MAWQCRFLHRSTEPGRSRHRAPDSLVDFHTGAEHLVRLIIKLPKLLAQTNLAKGEIPRLKRKIEDLLKYLRQNRARLFLQAYQLREKILSLPPPAPLPPSCPAAPAAKAG